MLGLPVPLPTGASSRHTGEPREEAAPARISSTGTTVPPSVSIQMSVSWKPKPPGEDWLTSALAKRAVPFPTETMLTSDPDMNVLNLALTPAMVDAAPVWPSSVPKNGAPFERTLSAHQVQFEPAVKLTQAATRD